MRTEFNALKDRLNTANIYDEKTSDCIHNDTMKLVSNLEAKILEVEKRMENANLASYEIKGLITLEEVDFELLKNCCNDIIDAMDLNNNEAKKDDGLGFEFEGSWGRIITDKDGFVKEVIGERVIDGEANYLFDIERVNIIEYADFCVRNNVTNGEAEDILLIGYWRKDGTYNPHDQKFREEIYGDAPTALCKDRDKYAQVKDIIAKLKAIEVDGETMEHILVEVGMEGQMLTQLVRGAVHLDMIEELINDEKERRK